jgi:NitT/TauT family transport system substrate-binding protein
VRIVQSIRFARIGALLALAAVAAAGCGSGGDDGGEEAAATASSGSAIETVKVGVLPIAPLAPVYLGIERGFFEDEGLAVEPVVAQGGAAIVPAVVSGDMAFGYSNPGSVLLAHARGLDLQIVAEGNQTAERKSDDPQALVAEASRISDARQLEGEKVAVDTLGGLTELAVRDALRRRGVDDSEVTLVEVPFPDMFVALDTGRVAAASMNEPFVADARKHADLRVLANPFFDTLGSGASISEYFTSARYAQEHPDVVARFQRAIGRSLRYAHDHPDEVRRIVKTFTKTDPETVEVMKLTQFAPDLNVDSIRHLAELMVEYGQLEEQPSNFDELVAPGP